MQLKVPFQALRREIMAPPTGLPMPSAEQAVAPPPPPPFTGSHPRWDRDDEYAIRTYRYVRIMIVALTVGLLTAVLVEGATAGCLLGSISAYYFTPARGLFTGGLIGIGVCLIAIRGDIDLQDGLLNLAGL